MIRILFILLVSLLAIAAPGQLDTSLARMDQAAASFKDLSANLTRTHHVAVIDENTEDRGTIVIKRPKPHELLMRVDIKEPDPKQVAVDSHKAEVYYPKSQTVQIFEIGKYKKLADQLLLLGFGATSQELAEAYTIALGGPDVVNSQKMTRLELTPKSGEMHLRRVDLWISDTTGLPVQQKLYWPGPNGGDYDVATYSNMRVNSNLPEASVKLELSRGVKREYPQK